MKSLFALALALVCYTANAQVTAITPDSAYQGQRLHTSITAVSLFVVSSTPQGNIQEILLKNATDSVFAKSDSTNVVSVNTAKTFWDIPAQLKSGIYNLIVRIYNTITLAIDEYQLSNAFTVLAPVVWPGDANNDHIVDMADLFPIGLAYDSTGPARTVQGISWQGDTARPWAYFFDTLTYANHVNYCFGDCNGDGIIDYRDTSAIIQNFSLTHAKTNGAPAPYRSGLPTLTFKFNKDTLVLGDTLIVTFFLGDSAITVSNFYALSFTFNYDNTAVDSTYTSTNFGPSWLGSSSEKIAITKAQNHLGTIKTGITRINHMQSAGSGPIGTATFKITTDNISGKDYSHHKFVGWITDLKAVDKLGNPVVFNTAPDTTIVNYYPVGLSEIAQFNTRVYPNPANNILTINSDDVIREVTLVNETGQIVYQNATVNTRMTNLDLTTIADGIYFIKLRTDKGKANHRISIVK